VVCYREVVNTEYARYINRVHYVSRVIRLHRRRRIASTSKCASRDRSRLSHSVIYTLNFAHIFLFSLFDSCLPSTLPIVLQTLKAQVNESDRQVRGLCHPKLVRRHPDHRDIALNHTLRRGSFVQHTTEPFPQKRDKG